MIAILVEKNRARRSTGNRKRIEKERWEAAKWKLERNEKNTLILWKVEQKSKELYPRLNK